MTTVPARQPESEPPERTERAGADGARVVATGAAGRVLALQRAAGNRAVTSLLARDPAPKAPPAKPAPAPPLPTSNYVAFPGVGTIPLMSVSFGVVYSGHGGQAPGATDKKPDIRLSSEQGPHSEALFKATMWGEPTDVEIVFVRDGTPYRRMKVKGALVISYTTSGPRGSQETAYETWTLNYQSIEVVQEKDTPAGER
jgi:hypothetical protein